MGNILSWKKSQTTLDLLLNSFPMILTRNLTPREVEICLHIIRTGKPLSPVEMSAINEEFNYEP